MAQDVRNQLLFDSSAKNFRPLLAEKGEAAYKPCEMVNKGNLGHPGAISANGTTVYRAEAGSGA
jgi:hypothetical protein